MTFIRRIGLRHVLLIVFGLLVGIGLGSAVYLRSVRFDMPVFVPSPEVQIPAWIEGDYPLRDDTEIGFVARENASTLRHDTNGVNFYVFTDGRGARKNLPTADRPKRCDIITIGCSFSWGHGVENADTYSALIERKTHLHVENFAMGSYGTVQSFLMLRRNKDLTPKYVIYGWIDDHLNRNINPCAPNNIPICAATPYIDAKTLSILAPIRSDSMKRSQQFYERARLNLPQSPPDVSPRISDVTMQQKLDATGFLLKQMKRECDSIGATLVVLDLTRISTGRSGNSLVEPILPEGVVFIDMTETAASWPRKRELHLPTDGHPSPLAHQLIAQKILQSLSSLSALVARR